MYYRSVPSVFEWVDKYEDERRRPPPVCKGGQLESYRLRQHRIQSREAVAVHIMSLEFRQQTTDGSDISPQAGHCDPLTATGLALLRLLLLDSDFQTLKVYVCRSCLQFATVSQGFHFDKFSGTVTVGIPITISWHRDVYDTRFVQNYIILGLVRPFPTSTDTTQPDGMVNVTFPITGSFVVAALDIYAHIIATTQTFNVAPDVSLPIPIESVISSTFSVTETGQPPSDSMESAQSTAPASPSSISIHDSDSTAPLSSFSSTELAQSTAPASPSSISTHRNHKTPIVIGAVTGSLVFLLIILGGGTFLFIRKRRYGKWNLKHRLSPNPKIIPQHNFHSPPVGNKNRETISPRREGDMTVNLGDRSWETVEHSQEGNSTEVERERRNSIGAPDTLESQSVQQEAALDVVAEVLRLRNHVQQIIEREAEEVQASVLSKDLLRLMKKAAFVITKLDLKRLPPFTDQYGNLTIGKGLASSSFRQR
ncbi:hypothetical protein ARMGADRAFT_1038491 [Armillaria gallica]|uniref:Uncharacterized protein n=1 Tax=Armillaria gallica TaxID=47427 RepID=A0A2H3CHR8_ARMGA|nr:hypothetical protein ARMGADRAFT_1038491 [Armillaria gallica]